MFISQHMSLTVNDLKTPTFLKHLNSFNIIREFGLIKR